MATNINTNEIKVNRPKESAFLQQKLGGWRPIISPFKLIMALLIMGISFIPTGTFLLNSSTNIYEMSVRYDPDSSTCSITSRNEGKQCQVYRFKTTSFTTAYNDDIYRLTNFFQNHHQYIQSRDSEQLKGHTIPCNALQMVKDPVISNHSLHLSPCGSIANSYFNDVIKLNAGLSKSGITLNEEGISLETDRKSKFGQPTEFTSQKNPGGAVCDSLLEKTGAKSYRDADNIDWCFWYPNDDATEYLYEMYPEVSPLMGVTDEHFIVWMRTASTPTFRKLYGKISGDFNKGDIVTFNVTSNFEVRSLSASKSLVLSNRGQFGGKNKDLGTHFIVIGALSLVAAVVIAIKGLYFRSFPIGSLPSDW